jgi:lipid-binding SYLF domain-containing protein
VRLVLAAAVCASTLLTLVPTARAASAEEIDIKVDAALKHFQQSVDGADVFLDNAKGVLVFPSVFKVGFVFGGEYGEGALRIDGVTADYYNTAGASFGLQLGAQSKTVILVFLKQDALDKFRASRGWEAGVDGSVALVELGAGGTVDTTNIQDPIVGFVFGNKGLMANITLEGSKFTKLKKGEVGKREAEAAHAGDKPAETAGTADDRQ